MAMSTTTRLTIDQFDQMIAEGVFEKGPNRERIELIDGELREMSPIGPVHDDIVQRLTRWSCQILTEHLEQVRIQMSIDLPDFESVLEPDVAWVRNRDYFRKRPSVGDALLVIEVADSSLRYDRGEKADLYAAAGIADYWVVDIPNQAVHVYRDPQSGKFVDCQTFRRGYQVSPLHVPTAQLVAGSLFQPDDSAAAP